jgi:hypothetical protein
VGDPFGVDARTSTATKDACGKPNLSPLWLMKEDPSQPTPPPGGTC